MSNRSDIMSIAHDISALMDRCDRIGIHTSAMALAYDGLSDALFWVNRERKMIEAKHARGVRDEG